MTGKSTFLDGLRLRVGKADLPNDNHLKAQVESRGRIRFLGSESADVPLKIKVGGQTTESVDHWQADFFSQNELQRLAQEPEAVEDVLARFEASGSGAIEERNKQLRELDTELIGSTKELDALDGEIDKTEQAYERSRRAVAELEAFKDAGIEDYRRASRNLARWRESAQASNKLAKAINSALQSAEGIDMPEIDGALAELLSQSGVEEQAKGLRTRWERIVGSLDAIDNGLADANAAIESVVEVLKTNEESVLGEMNRKLAALGMGSSSIDQFQVLSRRAALVNSYKTHFDQLDEERLEMERRFEKRIEERNSLIKKHRAAFDRVIKAIDAKFKGQISARRIENGNLQPLDRFIRNLNERGVTRWWNEHRKQYPASELVDALNSGRLADVGMTDRVQSTFRDALTRSRKRELKSIRCPDRYLLVFKMGEGDYRPLEDLSGGKKVSLLLSLLLETDDNRPLVIDQPEDELDNKFLFGTILQVLKRLKGRRQIIVATHNANIVVNGDADQVIQLEAEADRWLDCAVGGR